MGDVKQEVACRRRCGDALRFKRGLGVQKVSCRAGAEPEPRPSATWPGPGGRKPAAKRPHWRRGNQLSRSLLAWPRSCPLWAYFQFLRPGATAGRRRFCNANGRLWEEDKDWARGVAEVGG